MTPAYRHNGHDVRDWQARLREIGPVRRIAIVRALQLGDLLVATPALRSLRAGFPDAEITLIGLPWVAQVAPRFARYIDRVVAFPGWPGISEAPYDAERVRRFLAEQQAYGYDLVIQMHGDGRASNAFALALGGRVTAGYAPDGAASELSLAARYPNDRPEILRNLGIAQLLGCPGRGTHLEFPLTTADHAEADRLLAQLVGARAASRRWPAQSFATVADQLAQRISARILLTGGPDEVATVATVERAMRAPALNLAGKTSLGGLAALLSRLDLLISNDSGPAHLAKAVGAPTVRIFGPADVRRWGPLHNERHTVVRVDVECSPCGYVDCPIDHRCLRQISPAMVLASAERSLMKGAIA
jgi:ADP-heptose:LPS heptosyltransferase